MMGTAVVRRVAVAVGLVAAVAYLALGGSEASPLALVLKPLPVWAIAVATAGPGRTRRLVTAALVVAGIADVAIDLVFLVGMAVFAAGHLLYIAAFVARSRRPALALAVPFVLWPIALLAAIFSHLGPLRGPVCAYAAVLGTMMWRAAATGVPWIAAGAVVFGASDSLIALRLGGVAFAGQSVAIMVTYWLGQAMIGAGAMSAGERAERA